MRICKNQRKSAKKRVWARFVPLGLSPYFRTRDLPPGANMGLAWGARFYTPPQGVYRHIRKPQKTPPKAFLTTPKGHEIVTVWQIDVLTRRPCTFLAQMGHFRHCGTCRLIVLMTPTSGKIHWNLKHTQAFRLHAASF